MIQKTLFLLRGVPGAGKTTLATFLTDLLGHDAFQTSADNFMFEDGNEYDPKRLPEVHKKCQEAVLAQMQGERDVIFVHNTMTREWELDDYFQMAEANGYRVFSLIVENRHGNKSVHNFPEEGYDKYADRFQIKLKGG